MDGLGSDLASGIEEQIRLLSGSSFDDFSGDKIGFNEYEITTRSDDALCGIEVGVDGEDCMEMDQGSQLNLVGLGANVVILSIIPEL